MTQNVQNSALVAIPLYLNNNAGSFKQGALGLLLKI